jgi:hypothetical protein
MAVVVTSGGAPAPGVALAAVAQVGAHLPSVESVWDVLARWIDGVSSAAMADRVWAKTHIG